METRQAGVLLPVFSLPSPYGIGSLGKAAYDWIDWLVAARMRIWQMLPLVPTGDGNSPYSSVCASAFSPYLIDLDTLVERGLLDADDLRALRCGDDPTRVDYARVRETHDPMLRKAFDKFDRTQADFVAFAQQENYLNFAYYQTIKQLHAQAAWTHWDASLRNRTPDALHTLRAACGDEIDYWLWTQYECLRQWNALRDYARDRGILLMGDMPMYVAHDSVEVWTRPELFDLDPVTLQPRRVAGVPPDYFCADGQLWGNPLYAWQTRREDCLQWWNERIAHAMALFDIVRIDHFRAFDRYYSVDAKADTAREGEWLDGARIDLFRDKTHLDIVAEDLGTIDDGVRELIAATGYPGMRVLEFGMDGNRANDHKPCNYPPRSVAYTGTHDNMPLAGFLLDLTEAERETFARELRLQCRLHNVPYDDTDDRAICDSCIRTLYASLARRVILPVQDILGGGKETRVNLPGTVSDANWSYRMRDGEASAELARKYAELARQYERCDDAAPVFDDAPGARHTKYGTRFRIWSPTGRDMRLRLYRDGERANAFLDVPMRRDGEFYETYVGGDLHGVYYTFVNNGRESVDPCALAVGVNGLRGMIVDLRRTDPDGWQDDRCPRITHPIVWEVHVRDFSIDPSLACPQAGKYGGFARGARTAGGYSALVDYLVELGVTYVQLLPVSDYCTVDEHTCSTRNWGYDPWLYSAPEGSYSADPTDGASRIRELKQLIATLHAAGIGVILDVVYNHTYYSDKSNLEILAPDCYYRKMHGRYLNASGCGTEIASERDQVRAMIVRSVCHWAKEYHADGFRFDLMGCLDTDTMRAIRSALDAIERDEHRTILTYGEPWTALPTAPWIEPCNLHHIDRLDPTVGVFNCTFRDGLRGSNAPTRGYIQGDKTCLAAVISGIEGGTRLHGARDGQMCVTTPSQQIGYMSAHDDYTLYDQLRITMPYDDENALLTANKLGAFVLMSSLCVPFMQAGEEFARTKQYQKNTYCAPDDVNQLDWSRRERYDELVQFYRGLIDIRKHNAALADLQSAQQSFEWIAHEAEYGVLVYKIGKMIYCVNPTLQPAYIDLSAYGRLRVLADWTRADYARKEYTQGVVTVWQRNMLCLELAPQRKPSASKAKTAKKSR